MTVCPLLYNLSNFIRLGPGPSYKFWEAINYRRGINDVAQSLIPMTVCPLLYHCPFSSNLQFTLSQPTLSTPQFLSLITPWANTPAPRDTSWKGCASPCASWSVVMWPSRRERWRNGYGLCMVYASHKPPSVSPWNAVMNCWRWRRTPVSRPRDLHCIPVWLCSTHRWSLCSNAGSLSSRTRWTWMETCYAWRRHASCKSFILMF